jgi:predicted transcriptional regulator
MYTNISKIINLAKKDGYEVIGPPLTTGAKELLDFIMKEGVTTTSQVVDKFGVSAQNASAKLKKLFRQGIILGAKESAESGGIEFVYKAIK